MKSPLSLRNYDAQILARLSAVFIFSAAGAICLEILVWRAEPLLAFLLLLVIYFLGCLRFLPWRTPMRKALSAGILLGLFISIIFFKFGIFFVVP
jgi:hypothetical protein